MGENKFVNFFKNNGGFLIGLLIGVIVVFCRIAYFVLDVAIMLAFGFLGMYIQRNKTKVKTTLKNMIDKI